LLLRKIEFGLKRANTRYRSFSFRGIGAT
jgi:hypothetical protein